MPLRMHLRSNNHDKLSKTANKLLSFDQLKSTCIAIRQQSTINFEKTGRVTHEGYQLELEAYKPQSIQAQHLEHQVAADCPSGLLY